MNSFLTFDLLLVLLVLTNLLLLVSSRLVTCIRTVAAQGVALALLPLVLGNGHAATIPGALLALAVVLLKGAVFPWLLFRAVRVANVKREIEPYVSYTVSLLIGILALFAGYGIAARLPLPDPNVSPHLVPVAVFTMMTGLLLLITRRKALTQVVGYLALENGIYTFGVAVARDGSPWLVELGILLDIFVAVFVMGIAIFHISREFDHIDADQLTALKD